MENSSLPPVHKWNPEFCGDIDMRIRRDGSWDYMGTPITRERMVKLFSTILRRDDDEYFLVTPVEKVGIRVDDAPFVAVELSFEKENGDDYIYFRTNLDDYVRLDEEHPIKIIENPETGEPSPYIRVRDDLDALLSRSAFYELADHAIEQNGSYAVKSGNKYFKIGKIEE
ncbi:DUF1285 domain-containing protein [Pseudemcibacter aquimaris]|uniref:DUF1285 domain-containing protein n=1 Tax=Pseudemcibacter aquimaris TaxID=2857064 RepID=UPI003B83240F